MGLIEFDKPLRPMGQTIGVAILFGFFGFLFTDGSVLGLMSGATLGAVFGGTSDILAAIKRIRPPQDFVDEPDGGE